MTDGVAPSAHPARRTAILTALGWHLLPLAALVASIVAAATHNDQEGWGDLAAIVLALYGGGTLVVSAAIAAVLAAALAKGRDRAGFGWGTLAAVLGWVIASLALVALFVLLRATG
jgi:hypothetical protein